MFIVGVSIVRLNAPAKELAIQLLDVRCLPYFKTIASLIYKPGNRVDTFLLDQ
jgi:hypothetical protein